MLPRVSLLLGGAALLLLSPALNAEDALPETTWKAGVARVAITPERPMWMAGYAARTKPSEGVLHDLFAKALAIEDQAGTRLVIVTTDLIGIPRNLRESLEQKLQEQHGLPPESLLLNASHTHCGPELRASKASAYGLGDDRVAQAIEYMKSLEANILSAVGEALNNLQPAQLQYTHARCGFAMNRRLIAGESVRNSPNPEGPVDHHVPVLKVAAPDGSLKAILFGYACHNTTLSLYEFCGDYAGFAQIYLEEAHPGTTAMFMMGCGGDQNPYPRRTVELCQQHGRSLANSVMAALEYLQPRTLRGPLRPAIDNAVLEFAPPPSREELTSRLESTNRYLKRHAERLLKELDDTGTIRTEYTAPIQVVRFGDDLTLVALPGETVVDYSLRLRKELAGAAAVWVAGYSNDVFAYIPSRRVLEEGGYEGGGAMIYGVFPGPFKPSVEESIVGKAHELLEKTNSR